MDSGSERGAKEKMDLLSDHPASGLKEAQNYRTPKFYVN